MGRASCAVCVHRSPGDARYARTMPTASVSVNRQTPAPLHRLEFIMTTTDIPKRGRARTFADAASAEDGRRAGLPKVVHQSGHPLKRRFRPSCWRGPPSQRQCLQCQQERRNLKGSTSRASSIVPSWRLAPTTHRPHTPSALDRLESIRTYKPSHNLTEKRWLTSNRRARMGR